jgi:hypothetical protein
MIPPSAFRQSPADQPGSLPANAVPHRELHHAQGHDPNTAAKSSKESHTKPGLILARKANANSPARVIAPKTAAKIDAQVGVGPTRSGVGSFAKVALSFLWFRMISTGARRAQASVVIAGARTRQIERYAKIGLLTCAPTRPRTARCSRTWRSRTLPASRSYATPPTPCGSPHGAITGCCEWRAPSPT